MRRAVALLVWVGAVASCGGQPPPAAPSAVAEGTFASGAIRLSYALDLPGGSGPFPAFVLGHGSGRSTKEEARDLAARLVAEGYAVLRYDKRGVGQSTGVYEGVGVVNSPRVLAALADDMAAGVAFLRTRPDIDGRRIGLIGASQAGWIIPGAARRASVAWMVILSGPAVSVGEEIYYSGLAEGTGASFEELSAQLAAYGGPRGFDPRPDLEALATPGLWLLGGQDRSVPTRETSAILRGLAAAGRPYRVVVYDEAGHSLGRRDFWPDILDFLPR